MSISDYYKNIREKVGNELLFMPSVAGIVRNERGEILFLNKGNGENWSLPAGAIELGEAPAEALVREVREETGLIVIPSRLLGVFGGSEYRYVYPNGHQVEYHVYVFECIVQSGDLNPLDCETAELRYFRFEDMPTLALPYPKSIFSSDGNDQAQFQWNDEWTKKY